MFLSAKAFFEDGTANNTRVLIRAETQIPQEFTKRYRKNVVAITPKKSGALRRSIITQAIGNKAEISWRLPYAGAQNVGHHTVARKRVINIGFKAPYNNLGYVTLSPGVYPYRNYTTPGTGPRFASIAYQKTQSEMPAVMRELGLTK